MHNERQSGNVTKLVMKPQEFKPFQRYRDKQMCLSTNDVVPSDIRDDLLTA